MFRPNGQRRDFTVGKEVTVIGRGENCDLQIPLENVSRRHCEVGLSEGELKVKDLASSNGTYVNNKRINESPLAAGDRLVVGPIVFTIQIDGIPEEIIPIKTSGERQAETPGGEEEIVELEADVATHIDGAEDDMDIFAAVEASADEIDPIAALEALAAESEKKEKGKK
ncbi:MAG TPA: FHA domain-containing protein [Phycisphaerae bacterium]|nr:FHA domain-containing protein [Phycisphaerae bacterium]